MHFAAFGLPKSCHKSPTLDSALFHIKLHADFSLNGKKLDNRLHATAIFVFGSLKWIKNF